jgi:hypothetical protein
MPKKTKKIPEKKSANTLLNKFLQDNNIELSTIVKEVETIKDDEGIFLINKPIIKIIAKYRDDGI